MSLFWQILIFSALGGAAALVGSALLLINESWARKISIYLISFATGIILAIAFLELLPESLHNFKGGEPFFYVLCGIVLFFLLEKSMIWYHCHGEETCELHVAGPMSLLGDAIHNFSDGIIIAISFLANYTTGLATAIAIVLHEIPQEVSDFSILLHSGMKRSRALFLNVLVALAAPVGAVATFAFSGYFKENLGLTLALAAGGLIYIAVADLIPQLHKVTSPGKSILQILFFILGNLAGWWLAR